MNYQKNGEPLIKLSDEEIIELYWNREEMAIEATDHKYGKYLYSIAYNIIHDKLDCEECLNDTYIGTWNSIPPKRPTVLQVFLAKIMRNNALGRFRKMSASKRVPSEIIVSLEELDECADFEPGEDEKYFVEQLSAVFNSYLRSLTDRQLFVFICRYYYSDTVPHIASMLKMSENTVLRDLSKIRAGLKERLEKEGYHI